MHSSNYLYHHGEQELLGFLCLDDNTDKPRPAVLIAHDWSGRNEFACNKAEMLAKKGYVALAIDMFGMGRTGKSTAEKAALIEPLVNDRLLLVERIRAAYDALIGMPEVDTRKIAAIGFCFGGMCVLDLARAGAELKGVVSIHGLLNRAKDIHSQAISAKILALHGYDDPMVKPEDAMAFCREMTEAKVDWQLHIYGNTQHAFTNPHAHDPVLGTVYNPQAETRAFKAMDNFFDEIFS